MSFCIFVPYSYITTALTMLYKTKLFIFQLTCLDIFATYGNVQLQSLYFDIIAPCTTVSIHSFLRYCVATTPLLRHSSTMQNCFDTFLLTVLCSYNPIHFDIIAPCTTVSIHSFLPYCVATTPLLRHSSTTQNCSDTFLLTVLCSYNPSISTSLHHAELFRYIPSYGTV